MVSNYYFPEDITRDILIRLPVRSLFRFKAVCKHWFALITDSNFVNAHSHHPSNPKLSVLLAKRADNKDFCFPLYGISVVRGGTNRVDYDYRIAPFAMDKMPNPPGMCIVGSSNGLLCLFSSTWSNCINSTSPLDYILWNPVTGQYRYLSPPINYNGCSDVRKGFGFHHRANDYKLLHIQGNRFKGYEADVYSLSTDSWKEVKDMPDFDFCLQPLVLKGIWYAVAWKQERSSILKFDMGDDAFSMMKSALPCEMAIFSPMKLTVYKESLAIFLPFRMGPGSQAKFDMWVMKDECWTYIFKGCALPVSVIAPHHICSLLGTRNDEELILMKKKKFSRVNYHLWDDLSLCVFNPSTQQSNYFLADKAAGWYFYELAHDYVESMVSVYPTNQTVPKVLWLAPPRDWIKWNINGFALGKPGPAGIGGVLRNSAGKFLCIFSRTIGVADSDWADVKAIEKALELSSQHDNWPGAKLIVESYSLNAVAWMNRVTEIPSRMWSVYDRIQMLRTNNFVEVVIVQHARPGGNSFAEGLAEQAACRRNDLVAWL